MTNDDLCAQIRFARVNGWGTEIERAMMDEIDRLKQPARTFVVIRGERGEGGTVYYVGLDETVALECGRSLSLEPGFGSRDYVQIDVWELGKYVRDLAVTP